MTLPDHADLVANSILYPWFIAATAILRLYPPRPHWEVELNRVLDGGIGDCNRRQLELLLDILAVMRREPGKGPDAVAAERGWEVALF